MDITDTRPDLLIAIDRLEDEIELLRERLATMSECGVCGSHHIMHDRCQDCMARLCAGTHGLFWDDPICTFHVSLSGGRERRSTGRDAEELVSTCASASVVSTTDRFDGCDDLILVRADNQGDIDLLYRVFEDDDRVVDYHAQYE